MWKKGISKLLHQVAAKHTARNYGKNAKVMFYNYLDEPTTKDTIHLKHTKGKKGRLVKYALNSKISMSKEKTLLNKVNKQVFLWHLT